MTNTPTTAPIEELVKHWTEDFPGGLPHAIDGIVADAKEGDVDLGEVIEILRVVKHLYLQPESVKRWQEFYAPDWAVEGMCSEDENGLYIVLDDFATQKIRVTKTNGRWRFTAHPTQSKKQFEQQMQHIVRRISESIL